MNRGTTLIELILYVGMLSTILVVLYEFYALATTQKTSQLILTELSTNADFILTDISRSLTSADTISEPLLGNASNTLSIEGGAIQYSVDGSGIVQKTENGTTLPISTDGVIVDAVTFEQMGPSADYPTVVVELELRGRHLVDGREYSHSYRTAVTKR